MIKPQTQNLSRSEEAVNEMRFLYWVLSHAKFSVWTGWWNSRVDEIADETLRRICRTKIRELQ